MPTVTRRSCIAWRSAACVFGGVRLISSARIRLWKIGPGEEAHAPVDDALVVLVLLQDVGAGDVGGQEVGRELDAAERQIERLRERRDEQRLGEARHADEERVAAREERDEHEVDDLLLPDDACADRVVKRLARAGGAGEELDVARRLAAGADGAVFVRAWRNTGHVPCSHESARRVKGGRSFDHGALIADGPPRDAPVAARRPRV